MAAVTLSPEEAMAKVVAEAVAKILAEALAEVIQEDKPSVSEEVEKCQEVAIAIPEESLTPEDPKRSWFDWLRVGLLSLVLFSLLNIWCYLLLNVTFPC